MTDFADELLNAIQERMKRSRQTDQGLIKAAEVVLSGASDYTGLTNYAIALGECLSNALKAEISAEKLPNGQMTSDLAQTILEPVLREQYAQIAFAAELVQDHLNQAARLGLHAVKPTLNQDRVAGLIKKISSYADFQDALWILEEPIINFSQNVVDDAVRVNVEAHAAAGLHPTVSRITESLKCPWCAGQAGVYAYPVPDSVYRRHERCRCQILFIPEKLKAPRPATKILYAGAEKSARDARIDRVLAAEARMKKSLK